MLTIRVLSMFGPRLSRPMIEAVRPVPVSAMAALLVAIGASYAAAPPSPSPRAQVQYLQNSGWIVATSAHVLIFDFAGSIGSADGDQVLPARLGPDFAAYGDRAVVVFVSHSHDDHWSPQVLEWAAGHPRIEYVVAAGVDMRGRAARVLRPHEEWSSGSLRVRTTGSTDEGVGFLVSTDGLTVFHAGDLAAWSGGQAAAFDAEIEWLRKQALAIDLAFFPIATGFACDPRPAIWQGVERAAVALHPRVLVPMHVRCAGRFALYGRFRSEVAPRVSPTQVMAPTAQGDRFEYEGGTLQPTPK